MQKNKTFLNFLDANNFKYWTLIITFGGGGRSFFFCKFQSYKTRIQRHPKFPNNWLSRKKISLISRGGSVIRNYVSIKNKTKVFSQKNFSFFFTITFWGQHKIFLDKKNIFLIFFKKHFWKSFWEKKNLEKNFLGEIFFPCFHEGFDY